MLAPNIWHWWIGVVLALAGVGAVLSLVVGYLKSVTAMKHPLGRRRASDDL
jgi:formate-dependent nitrite reductase membrane component NrfD